MLRNTVMVFCGGALGALMRWGLIGYGHQFVSPLALVVVVNVAGSALMGVAVAELHKTTLRHKNAHSYEHELQQKNAYLHEQAHGSQRMHDHALQRASHRILQLQAMHKRWQHFVSIGFCGGLTTFSTVAVDVAQLLHQHDVDVAFAFLFANVACSIAACVLAWKTCGHPHDTAELS